MIPLQSILLRTLLLLLFLLLQDQQKIFEGLLWLPSTQNNMQHGERMTSQKFLRLLMVNCVLWPLGDLQEAACQEFIFCAEDLSFLHFGYDERIGNNLLFTIRRKAVYK